MKKFGSVNNHTVPKFLGNPGPSVIPPHLVKTCGKTLTDLNFVDDFSLCTYSHFFFIEVHSRSLLYIVAVVAAENIQIKVLRNAA